MKRFAFPLVLVLGLVACDKSPPTEPSSIASPSPPALSEWIKDTVPLTVRQDGSVATDWVSDDLFPFHIYWHTGIGNVPERIRVAVRKAAAHWASIVNPTAVLPYVYGQEWSCSASDDDGNPILWQRYAEGEVLAGGFHLYVTSHRGIRWAGGLSFGPCIPRVYDAANERFRWAYHPVTGAPPNGMILISALNLHLWNDDILTALAVHEIGHNLGIGQSDRWDDGLARDSVLVDGRYKSFWVQTDSVAVERYIAMAERSHWPDPVYPLRKIPLRTLPDHWDSCTLKTYHRGVDVMAGIGHSIVTEVSASMLQGFQVDWDVFGNPGDPVYWTPEPYDFHRCPEVRLNLEALGLDGEDADSADILTPDFPVLTGDVRKWTNMR